ncbi:MAG: protein kinase [Solirubrobacterales bacterium]|nr:protein kinase [Solirubrobacterales bacterium]
MTARNKGAQLQPGSLVAGYRIEELVSRGGMGMVYRVRSVELDRVYALKVLAPEVAGDEEYRRRFTREIRIAAALRHPNIVAVHNTGEHEGRLFLVMDYILGADLEQVIRRSDPMEPHRATNLLKQVASALDVAHDRGLVHRDVKPANILIAPRDGGDHAYVTDFGLAKRLHGDASITALTKTGVVLGTVAYMSPEQITGGRMDGRADIYALGCVYFEMLSGAVPYGADESMMATLFAHVNEPPPLLHGHADYPRLGAVIARAMAKNPDDRYPSAGAFAIAAANALQDRAVPNPPTAALSGVTEASGRGPPPSARSHSQSTRKMVSVVRCRLTWSGENSDSESIRDVIDRGVVEARVAISRHGGTAEAVAEDEVLAVFGLPRAREDDALRAVRAAAEIGERLAVVARDVGVTLRARTGVDTGRVLTGRGRDLVSGQPVEVATKLQMLADAGDVLLSAQTLRLVRDAVEVEAREPIALRGEADPLPVFRLLGLDPTAPGLARRFDIPFVGRGRELRLLREAWERSVEERACHLVTVLGEAGVGKSRLVAELLREVGMSSSVLRARCLPYGEGITFWPITEALTPLGDVARPVIDRLRDGGFAAPEELFLAVRQLLESLSAERPVILHVDDLHWAEPMLLDLLDHIADLSRVGPILVLCAARLELLDLRPGWGGGKVNATAALLGPLTLADSEKLLDELSDELDPEMRSPVLSASDGNPLFLEELVALAREAGLVTVPATIEALLAARLERLSGEERDVLQCAAVEGEVFHVRAVATLIGERPAEELEPSLSSLVRKELIRPHEATADTDSAYRFRHLLIRDAAYDALTAETRARLHERFGSWLEARDDDIADEIPGWHLEQAVRYEQTLGGPARPDLARRAVVHLHTAGCRARDRGDVSAATNLLERAAALAPLADVAPDGISVDLAECLMGAGEVARADELLSTVEKIDAVNPIVALTRCEWMIRVRPHEAVQMIESKLPGILRSLAGANDESGLARAYLVASMPHWMACQWTLAGKQARLAAEHAEEAGDEGARSRALAFYVGCIVYGQPDVAAIARELDAIERDEPGPSLAARIELARGQLARLEGRFADAGMLMERAREGFRSLGMRELEAACDSERGVSELSADDPAQALEWLLRSDALLVELGQHALRSTTQALIAQTQASLNDPDAARAAIALSERMSASEDVLNFAITHRVRARLALADRNTEAAIRWARSAVANASRIDSLEVRADATLDLARVLAVAGRDGDAVGEARRALELFAAKGHRPGIDKAHSLLADLGVQG